MTRRRTTLADILQALQRKQRRPPYRDDEVLVDILDQADAISLSAQIVIKVIDTVTGGIVTTVTGTNLTPTVGKTAIGDALIDAAAQFDTGITYCCIGTDDTAPALGDTTLGAEHHRNTVTSKSRTGNKITISTDFTAAEATAAIEEVGLFGTSTATGTVDTGVLFGRGLLSYDNSGGTYDITVDYELTIG